MRKLLLIVFCGIVAASLASAAPVPCPGTPVNNIGPSTVFNCGGLTFDQFVISPTGQVSGAQVNIGTVSNVSGSEVDIDFQVAGIGAQNPIGDMLMFYRVTGGIGQIDLHFQAGQSTSGNVTVFDTACTTPFVQNVCTGTTLAQSPGVFSNGNAAVWSSGSFALTNVVYIKKDVQFNMDSLSDFVQSQVTPEPISFVLLGGGLLAIGLLRRRKA